SSSWPATSPPTSPAPPSWSTRASRSCEHRERSEEELRLLHRGGRARRHDAGLPPRSCRRGRAGGGVARGLPPRLPRRHPPSPDAQGLLRRRPHPAIPPPATSGSADAGGSGRRRVRPHRRLHPPPHLLQVPRADAAMGLPRLPRRLRAALSLVQPLDA